MATVLVKMNFCDFTHRITVTQRDDGDLDVHIVSPCEHVRDYAKNLGKVITIADVTDLNGSRVFDPEVLKPLTLTCLTPKGGIDAAWLELGMLSASRAKEVGHNEISYEEL